MELNELLQLHEFGDKLLNEQSKLKQQRQRYLDI